MVDDAWHRGVDMGVRQRFSTKELQIRKGSIQKKCENLYLAIELSDTDSDSNVLSEQLNKNKVAISKINTGRYGTCHFCSDNLTLKQINGDESCMSCLECSHLEKYGPELRLILKEAQEALMSAEEQYKVALSEPLLGDEGDRSQRNGNIELASFLQKRCRATVEHIHLAISRFNIGDFGCCDSCGLEISGSRLDSNPSHLHCIDCSALLEQFNR